MSIAIAISYFTVKSLERLLSPNQTGFLKNRSILHGSHYAQQIIQAATKQNIQIATFKADVFKAFDTLNWQFLIQSLHARGFPHRWIQSVQNRVLMGSSRVVLNSVAGKNITLNRGVRQGDPLSPYLFNLAIDFLPRWINKLNELNFLTPPFPNCKTCLLYADDTLLFLKPDRLQIARTKLIFHIFGKITGLNINISKSELAVTSAHAAFVHDLSTAIQCKHSLFPMKYLGLPLSDRRLKKTDYLFLIDRIQHVLSGWKAPLLSVGGRIVLINAVLSALPQYFMSVFMLPKWTIKRIDQIRRRFLWHGHKERQGHKRELYMVNWALATRPRQLGGLGIRNIQATNQALLMKWMWWWHRPTNDWWKMATVMTNDSHKPWDDPKATHFWKNLKQIAPAFSCSISHQVARGNTVQFWHDSWLGKPLKYSFSNLYQAALQKQHSVQQNRNGETWNIQFAPLNLAAQMEENDLHLHLQNAPSAHGQDTVTWLRGPPLFSVSSAYRFLTSTPSPMSNYMYIWNMKAPLRVAVFAWLMMINRLTTLDNLSKRGWHLPSMCIMCQQSEETTEHLFQLCTVAIEIRDYVFTAFAQQHPIPLKYKAHNSVELLTDCAVTQQARRWELTTCFVLWRERCRRTFSAKFRQHIDLVREIATEYSSWFSSNALPHDYQLDDQTN